MVLSLSSGVFAKSELSQSFNTSVYNSADPRFSASIVSLSGDKNNVYVNVGSVSNEVTKISGTVKITVGNLTTYQRYEFYPQGFYQKVQSWNYPGWKTAEIAEYEKVEKGNTITVKLGAVLTNNY